MQLTSRKQLLGHYICIETQSNYKSVNSNLAAITPSQLFPRGLWGVNEDSDTLKLVIFPKMRKKVLFICIHLCLSEFIDTLEANKLAGLTEIITALAREDGHTLSVLLPINKFYFYM